MPIVHHRQLKKRNYEKNFQKLNNNIISENLIRV